VDNPDTGPGNFGAELTPGLDAGLAYINKVLGGVHGHPLKLDICHSDTTTTTEVNCANKLVSDGVVAVLDNYDAGFASAYPIIDRAGVPIFGIVPRDPSTDHSQTAFFFGAPEEAFAVGPLQLFHQQGRNKITMAEVDTPAGDAYAQDVLAGVAKKLGMDLTFTYYPSGSANFTVTAAGLTAGSPQVTGLVGDTEGNCTTLLTAIRATGYSGPVQMGSCSDYVKSAPSDAGNTYGYNGLWLPSMTESAPKVVQDQITAYTGAIQSAGGNVQALGQKAVYAFAALVDLRDALQPVTGAITASSVQTALGNLKDFQTFMGPVGTCDHKQWPGTSSCTNQLLLYKVESGKYVPADAGSGFVPLNPNLVP
jgi:ABC-type branched-subunit amino acid transport system substrate-binding protein